MAFSTETWMWIGAFAGACGCVLGNTAIYFMQTEPSFEKNADYERLAYVAAGMAPIMLSLWLQKSLRLMQVGKILSNKPALALKPMRVSELEDHLEVSAVSQAFLTFGTVVIMAVYFSRDFIDERLPVAMGWMYSIGSLVYQIGRTYKLPAVRIFGLLLGSYWHNFPALVYCGIIWFGVKQTPFVFWSLFTLALVPLVAMFMPMQMRINKAMSNVHEELILDDDEEAGEQKAGGTNLNNPSAYDALT